MPEPAKKSENLTSLLLGRETLLPAAMLLVLVVMLVPLPTVLLDMLLAMNMAATILLLLMTLKTRTALDLSVFPSLLLLLTLFRLSLNVATTRLILLQGEAGRMVHAFGNFVVGGQLVVGLVVFMILVVIQFMVITKGAGRISEVAARFTLDALPGKQMAIDAELNSGAIDEKQAKQRRSDLARETEFYGAMDGASKFVRGDAIAGLLITAVNLFGGVIIGLMDGIPLARAIATYSVLTVGDGLISQIPALVIATSAGLLTTKATSGATLDDEIISQVFTNSTTLWASSGIIGIFALVPGLPKLPFLVIAGVLSLIANNRSKQQAKERLLPEKKSSPDEEAGTDLAPSSADHLGDFLVSDRSIVEVGARIVPFIESKRMKGLVDRVSTLRKELSKGEGLWVPQIRIRSNLHLGAEEYRIVISGRKIASATLRVDQALGIPPEGRPITLTGEKTQEPAFGLAAVWISPDQTKAAEQQGYTVVEPLNVLITHLGECLKRHAHELITREALKQMLDRVREFSPTVIDDLRPEVIRMGTLHQVILQLAEERFPLADLTLILETIIYHAPGAKSAEEIVDRVRLSLGRLACERYRSAKGDLRVLVFEPKLEQRLREHLTDGQLGLTPTVLQKFLSQIGTAYQSSLRHQLPLALVCDASLRKPLRRLVIRSAPDLGVLAFQELPTEVSIDPVKILQADEVFGDQLKPKDHPSKPAGPPAQTRRFETVSA